MDDLSEFDESVLGQMFHLNPISLGGKSEMLLLHGASYKELTRDEKPVDLDKEIETVIEDGEFLDMRQLDLRTTIKQALIGVSYVSECRLHTTDVSIKTSKESPSSNPRTSVPRKDVLKAYRKIR